MRTGNDVQALLSQRNMYNADVFGYIFQLNAAIGRAQEAHRIVEKMSEHGPVQSSQLLSLAKDGFLDKDITRGFIRIVATSKVEIVGSVVLHAVSAHFLAHEDVGSAIKCFYILSPNSA